MAIFDARMLGVVVMGSLALGGIELASASAAQAQAMITLEQAVKDCRLIPDKLVRLGCYDRAIDAASAPAPRQSMLSAPPSPMASAAPAPPMTAAPKSAAQPSVAAPASEAALAPPPPAAPLPANNAAALNGVAVHVASAAINGNNVLSVVTSEGETWLQTDSTEFTRTPQAGETMVITKNVFGKRTCHIEKLAAFYCKTQK